MNQQALRGLIDNRNIKLWNSINDKYKVTLKSSSNDEYSVYTEGETAIISIPQKICIESFTHELLHIYLRLKEVYVGSSLVLLVKGDKLPKILSGTLIEHIGNCLCHIKMLPKYLELGFDRQKFLLDYHTYKCTDADICLIKINFCQKATSIYNSYYVDFYIGKYIAIKADPNRSFDYTNALNSLEHIEKELFGILENFINDWFELDVDVYSPFHNYRDVVSKFYNDLERWGNNKTFM